MLTRRRFGVASLGTAAALPIAGTAVAAAGSDFALGSSVGKRWAKH